MKVVVKVCDRKVMINVRMNLFLGKFVTSKFRILTSASCTKSFLEYREIVLHFSEFIHEVVSKCYIACDYFKHEQVQYSYLQCVSEQAF